jgi:hypothetical protein
MPNVLPATETPIMTVAPTEGGEIMLDVAYDGSDAIATLSPTQSPIAERTIVWEEPAVTEVSEETCSCGADSVMGSWKCGNTIYYCPFVSSIGICSQQTSNSGDMVLLTEEQCAQFQTLSLDDVCPGDDQNNSLSNHVCYATDPSGTLVSASKIDAQGCDKCKSTVECTATAAPAGSPTAGEPRVVVDPVPPTASPSEPIVVVDPIPPTSSPTTPGGDDPQVAVDPIPPTAAPSALDAVEKPPTSVANTSPTSSPTDPVVVVDPVPPTATPSAQELIATEAPTSSPSDPIVVVDPIPPTSSPTTSGGNENLAPPFDCVMEYSSENNGFTVCPSSSESIVSLLGINGGEDTDGSLATGAGVIYGITLDPSSKTVTFQVINVFSETSDIYVRHEKFAESSTFLSKDCEKIPNAAACAEPTQNTITAACRDEKFALVHLFFATSDETVLSFVEDATIHKCCHADSYDPVTTGIVELVYIIDCYCPNEAAPGRMLRRTKE